MTPKAFITKYPALKRILRPFWKAFCLFSRIFCLIFPVKIVCKLILGRFALRKILSLHSSTQVFLLLRGDLGIISLNLHYAALWNKHRGNAAILVMSHQWLMIKKLASIICPEVPLICVNNRLAKWISITIEGQKAYMQIYSKVYAYLLMLRPNSIVILDHHNIDFRENFPVKYNRYFDTRVSNLSKRSEEFKNAYFFFNEHFSYREESWGDYKKLFALSDPLSLPPQYEKNFQSLKKNLQIHRPYILINLNTKYYGKSSKDHIANRRRIYNPDRFESVVDLLIKQGYDVVISGRSEQPLFKKQKHLIDYARSPFISLEHDLALIANAFAMISSKTGPEVFASIFHIPLLGLNYVEPTQLLPNIKYRYMFKNIWDRNLGRYLSWKEFLDHPIFYDYALSSHCSLVEYHEHEEKDILAGVEEFLMLLNKPADKWLEYTPLQQEYKELLRPEHLELYSCKGVPCNQALIGSLCQTSI